MSIAARTARLVRTVRAAIAGHDLLLYAAGATFYLAVAYVPLLLLAVRLAAAIAGHGTVWMLGVDVAALLPPNLDADRAARAIVESGSRLTVVQSLLSVLPATFYGEGLRRAFVRLAPVPADRPVGAWRGRLVALGMIAVSPIFVLAVLLVATRLSAALGRGVGALILGGYLSFLLAWVLISLGLLLAYRLAGPMPIRPRALLLGSFGAGSFVAGFLVGFAIFLHIPVAVGQAYGGFFPVAAAAVVGGWFLLLHFVVLVGYAVTLVLDRRVPPPEPGSVSGRSRPGVRVPS